MREIKDSNKEIGANIRAVRINARHTQEQLAEILEISPNHLSALERGISGATTAIIKKICTLYAISADVLLFGKLPDPSTDELTERLKHVRPELRPKINKVLLSLLEVLITKERIGK